MARQAPVFKTTHNPFQRSWIKYKLFTKFYYYYLIQKPMLKAEDFQSTILTKAPFISLKTTPLKTIGELGSCEFSCSNLHPS